ncbi:hypothetical protein ACSLBF_13050 [Pseudoalteromonas sp. T1lg65]|uniref:hypothetical protein n=1 Tax=Pseudoalteromonas sp. T1lg65 TaxID=2077101 RepID=UPI003F7906AC
MTKLKFLAVAVMAVATSLAGCSAQIKSNHEHGLIDCNKRGEMCMKRCDGMVDRPMEIQSCHQQCFAEQDSCMVSKETEDKWKAILEL